MSLFKIVWLVPWTLVFEILIPSFRNWSRFKLQWWSVSIVLKKLGWILSIPGKVKSSLKVNLCSFPAMSDGGPQILVDIEKIKESVIIDNELDSFKSHVMKLITCLQDLIFCLFADYCHSFFIPVGVTFAKRPLKSSIITVHDLVPFAIGDSAACWSYDYPLKIIRNISFLLVQFTSNLIWVAG